MHLVGCKLAGAIVKQLNNAYIFHLSINLDLEK